MSRDCPSAEPLIPNDWTPEQAVAVFEMLDQLRDIVCARYGSQIQDYMRENHLTRFDPGPPSDPPF